MFRTTSCGRSSSPAPYAASSRIDLLEADFELGLGGVEDVNEEPGSLEVGEELMTEPGAVGSAFDEPRDVGDGELPGVGPVHDAENRLERRERVVRDLRFRVRDAAQKRRFAGVGQARECRVDDELEPQFQVELVAGEAGLREARRLTRRRCEARVAATALPTSCGDDARVRRREVGDEPLGRVEELCPDRNADLGVLPVRSVLLASASVPATTGLDMLDPPVGGEVAEARVYENDDVAAASTVSSVGTASRHVLLAAEAEATVAATAGLGMDVRSVVEHRRSPLTEGEANLAPTTLRPR